MDVGKQKTWVWISGVLILLNPGLSWVLNEVIDESTYCSARHIVRAQSQQQTTELKAGKMKNREQYIIWQQNVNLFLFYPDKVEWEKEDGHSFYFLQPLLAWKPILRWWHSTACPSFKKTFWSPRLSGPDLYLPDSERKWEWAWGRKGLERTLTSSFLSFLRFLSIFIAW